MRDACNVELHFLFLEGTAVVVWDVVHCGAAGIKSTPCRFQVFQILKHLSVVVNGSGMTLQQSYEEPPCHSKSNSTPSSCPSAILTGSGGRL